MSRPRHESLADVDSPFPNRSASRFPSAQMTSDMFVRIEPWSEPVRRPNPPPTPPRSPRRFSSVIAKTKQLTWCQLVGIGAVGLFLIILIASGIILLVILPKKNHNSNPKNVFTTPGTIGPTLKTGYVRSSEMNVFKTTNKVEAFQPNFLNHTTYFGTSGTSLLYFQNTLDSPIVIPTLMERGGCSECTILNVAPSCTVPLFSGNCTSKEIIYCCQGCPNYPAFCSVGGEHFEHYANLTSYSYSGIDILEFSTVSKIQTTTVEFQKHRILQNDIYSGPVQSHDFTGYDIASAAVASRSAGESVNFLAAISTQGDLLIQDVENLTSTVVLPNYCSVNGILALSVNVYQDTFYIAVLYSDKFYVVTYGPSGAQALEGKYFGILYPIAIQYSFWVEGVLYLWYKDPKNGTVGVLNFEIRWTTDGYVVVDEL